MYLSQMLLGVVGGWYIRAFAALIIIAIPGLIQVVFLPFLIIYFISSYSYKNIGVEIRCKEDLGKLVKSLNAPVITKSYISKRSGLTMTYKMYGEGSKMLFLAAGLGCKEYL